MKESDIIRGSKYTLTPLLYIFTGVNISQAPESVPLLVPSYYTVARSITLSELNPRFNVMLLFNSNIWKMAPCKWQYREVAFKNVIVITFNNLEDL